MKLCSGAKKGQGAVHEAGAVKCQAALDAVIPSRASARRASEPTPCATKVAWQQRSSRGTYGPAITEKQEKTTRCEVHEP